MATRDCIKSTDTTGRAPLLDTADDYQREIEHALGEVFDQLRSIAELAWQCRGEIGKSTAADALLQGVEALAQTGARTVDGCLGRLVGGPRLLDGPNDLGQVGTAAAVDLEPAT